MITKQDCYIVSTYQSGTIELANLNAHDATRRLLEALHIPHKEVWGVYQGNKEQSFVIVGKQYQTIVEKLAKQYNQECYLHIHNDNFSELVYTDRKTAIGYFTNVSATEARGHASYTEDNGQFYVTK